MDQAQLAQFANQFENLFSELGHAPEGEADWAVSYRTGQKEDAVSQLERALTSSPGAPEVTLWWIRVQLELGEVPITALTAPLEEILPATKGAPELEQLAGENCILAGAGLLRRGQPRLAVNMLAQARGLGKGLPGHIQGQLDAELKRVVEAELEQAPLRRENKQYLDFLEETLKSLQQENIPLFPGRDVKTEHQAGPAPITSKSILDSARASGEREEDGVASSEPRIEPGSSRTALRLIAALAVVAILLLVIPLGWMYVFSAPEAEEIAQRVALNTQPEIEAQPALPEVEQPKPEDDERSASALDQVGERIKQLAFTERKDETSPVEAPRSNEVDPTALDPSRAKVLPRKQDDELVSLSELPETEGHIKETEIPQIDPGRFSNTQVEEVGTTPRRAPVEERPEELRRDSEGRIYGPPRSNDPAQDPGRRGIDGRRIESHEVQVLDPPSLYTTIAATEVLSAPSLLSQSLARLEANTPVHVTRRMGHWLELRSTGGRVGYIYAQDAVPGRR